VGWGLGENCASGKTLKNSGAGNTGGLYY